MPALRFPSPPPAAVLLAGLAACKQDPILERAEAMAGARPAGQVGPAPPPAAGRPGAPPPPDASGAPGAPAGTVRLAGTVTGPAGLAAPVRVDVFDGDQADLSGPRPRVVAVQALSASGSFDIALPAGGGPVWVGAFADLDGNGRPDPGEPSGWSPANPVALDRDRADVDVVLRVAP